eukprot:TRINITY_DN38100_c0_g1_i1.p1 TRINITY_DN38100_c0_g1~~TRINITY_DN38100_c0_g1_i1.p1  ORF type:complete len:238 (-),score=42.33 TRINITY_DN38100_c0_g1_i1:78-734(-)
MLFTSLGQASAGLSSLWATDSVFSKFFSWFSPGSQELSEEAERRRRCPPLDSLVEERNVETLEVLLAEERCPFVVAFFSASSPLAQSEDLAFTEQRLATAFRDLRYIRVDADQLSIRAFLQWDISFLPTYTLFWPRKGKEQKWHHWQGKNGANPYDYHSVASWVTRCTGLMPGNSSDTMAGPVPPRMPSPPMFGLTTCWAMVGLAVLHRCLNWQPFVG